MSTDENTEHEQPYQPPQPPAQPQAAVPAPSADATPRTVDLRRPSWLTRGVAVAGSVAAATFVLGGAAGYAVGHGSGDDHRMPAPSSRDGRGPGFGPAAGQQGPPGFQQ